MDQAQAESDAMSTCDLFQGILICGYPGLMVGGDWPHLLFIFMGIPIALLAAGIVIGRRWRR